MLEHLKRLATQKLMEKMMSNSLGEAATGEAANEGVGALLGALKGGGMGQLTALLGAGGSEGTEEGAGGIVENLQGKLSEILQSKGMGAEEANAEAKTNAADLIGGLKEKFQSEAEEDKDFDISNITDLLGGGNAGDLLNKAKNIFG